ncbi:MAG: pyridoxine 5'-phosphate synthase [Bacteroidia bacterium]|nr:pyridoxine 5'-phosphate synthase [Bacteroidia bacterium]
MTQLSVNVNKIALIRNSRGGNNPHLLQVAHDLIRFGADGITVHPRPDERHIRKADVYELKPALPVEFNVEGYPSEEFLKMIEEVRPAQATLVPDPPGALTSSEGWDTITHADFLKKVIARIKKAGVRTSIFIETDLEMIKAAPATGTDRIELYTGPYAEQYHHDREAAVAPYREAAKLAHSLGLGLNAGHDLDLHNLHWFNQQVPHLEEVSIGHALVCDALYLGLEETIHRYQACLGKVRNTP